ncbi:ATP synthase subunit b [Bacteroidia bacterium]|nr:ATP synthase subunit b [Bacteroidia bacterium]
MLLVPDTGLLFWMTVSFAVVLAVLVRYAFPVILRAMESRRTQIEKGIGDALQAEKRLADADMLAGKVMAEAEASRAEIMRKAEQARRAMLEQARSEAEQEAARRMARARVEIEELRRHTIDSAMGQIAGLSLQIAEKVVDHELESDEKQKQLIEQFLTQSHG